MTDNISDKIKKLYKNDPELEKVATELSAFLEFSTRYIIMGVMGFADYTEHCYPFTQANNIKKAFRERVIDILDRLLERENYE